LANAQMLVDLPLDLVLHAMRMLVDPMDCAAARLAVPWRAWGVPAAEVGSLLPTFHHGPLYEIAVAVYAGYRRLDEGLMRQYARHRDASKDGCDALLAWMERTPALEPRASLHVTRYNHAYDQGTALYIAVWHLHEILCFPARVRGCKVRVEMPDGEVRFFEGPRGAERIVRAMLPDGTMLHYQPDGTYQ